MAPARRRPTRQAHSGAPARAGLPASGHRLALAGVLALSVVMNTCALSRNGWANGFYSAGVKSMLGSLHNFLYVSFDPGGLVSIDKPPLSMWVQVASAKVFGFTPLSVLLPEALIGVASVAVVYLALARPLGRWAALAAALALAIFPAFVAVSRDNNPDALLILLMILSCWAALRAIDSGRLRTVLLCGLLVGLAFNTKTLAAYLVLPGIAVGYMLCAPGSLRARSRKLLAGGLVMAVVSLAWLSFVDLTPASQRPYVGSSTDNSELGLTFSYNGLGRLDGQEGGPGSIQEGTGAFVPISQRPSPGSMKRLSAAAIAAENRRVHRARAQIEVERDTPVLPDGRDRHPTAFGAPIGPLRLFEDGGGGKAGGLGGQAGWLLPLGLVGALALALAVGVGAPPGGDRRDGREAGAEDDSNDGAGAAAADPLPAGRRAGRGRWRDHPRRDPRLAALIVFGGWMLVEAVVLSYAQGIVHPYYASELAPGVAAMIGGGVTGLAALWRSRPAWSVALLALAAALTVLAEAVILERNHYLSWLVPVMATVAAVCVIAAAVSTLPTVPAAWRSRIRAALAVALLAVLLVAPAAFSADTWTAPVQGTFPVAGPHGAAGFGGYDAPPQDIRQYRSLLAYISRHHPGSRFSVLTVSSVTAAPMILMGSPAASLAGYSGLDPALSADGLARLVRRGQARYVLLGGPYSTRGGNAATKATLRACRQLPDAAWGGVRVNEKSFVLFDCAGDAAALERAA